MNQQLRRFEDEYVTNNQIIGQGAFAQVVLAENKITGEKVAVKLTNKNNPVSQKEKQILLQLVKYTHPNVVQIVDIFDQQNMLLIVQEYCSGGSLYELMVERQTFTETEAIDIIYQVAEGIQFLHSNNIVHRDIKPENVLRQISDNIEQFKITDFGLSAEKEQHERMTTTKVGTAYYVAPEILDGKGYDKSVDIWAMGLMLDELLHGSPFYNGNSEEEVFKKIRSDTYTVRNTKFAVFDEKRNILKKILIGSIERDPLKRKDLNWILQQIDQYKKPKEYNVNSTSINLSIVPERTQIVTSLTKSMSYQQIHQQNKEGFFNSNSNQDQYNFKERKNCQIHHLPLSFMVPQSDKMFSCCQKCLQQFQVFEINEYNNLISQSVIGFQTKGFDYYFKIIIFQKELQQMIEGYQDSAFLIVLKESLTEKFNQIGIKYMKLARQEFNETVEKIRIGAGQDFISLSMKSLDTGNLNRISQYMGQHMSKFRKDAVKECEIFLRAQLQSLVNMKLDPY